MEGAVTPWSSPPESPSARAAGFRFGEKGTHTSRTLMLAELGDLLRAVPAGASREAYVAAVIDENVLGKQTAATRQLTSQRLVELYGLDLKVPIFRVLRRVWQADEGGRPLSAMLCALARDPLLRAAAPSVLALTAGAELIRSELLAALRACVGARLNDAVLDKVARNVASSWSQSGHLEGRVRKLRCRVRPTPGPVAFALWLGAIEGLVGEQLLASRWAQVLDSTEPELIPIILQAKQLGLVTASVGGGVTNIDATKLAAVSGAR